MLDLMRTLPNFPYWRLSTCHFRGPNTLEFMNFWQRSKGIYTYIYINIMYILIAVSLFIHNHACSLGSTDLCKENGISGIPRNLSDCSSCLGRCGETMNRTNYKPCACDVLCMAHGECCGDFKQFCTEDYTTAQSIAKHYGGLKSTCVDVNDVPFARRPTPTHPVQWF